LLKYGVRRPFAQIMTLLPTNKGIFAPSSHAHYVGDDAEQSIFQRADEAIYLSKFQNKASG